jgi:uncharacterized protein
MKANTPQPAHNIHLTSPELFEKLDVQLSRLRDLPYQYRSPLLDQLPQDEPGIYTLGGGRQVGKSTLVKQWMAKLLKKNIKPECITYLTGEIIDDHKSLISELQILLTSNSDPGLHYIILDEVTYINRWALGIKYLADSGLLDNVVLLLTGSDLAFIQEAVMFFPGRRGKADVKNFHLYPLSFSEVVRLDNQAQITDSYLEKKFSAYLLHGGYLTAINEYALDGKITTSTLQTYSEWIRGDMLRRGKQELYLKEILSGVIKRYGCQLSWQSLSRDLSIDHHKTVSDYCEILEKMDAINILHALLEDKLIGAPKKQKKIYMNDPFIYHAAKHWIHPNTPLATQLQSTLNNPEEVSSIVEGVVVQQYRRQHPTYYIKAEGEVDIAYVKDNRFWPVEVKWTNQIHPKDLKQIQKYTGGIILSKQKDNRIIAGITAKYLPRFLYETDQAST